MRFAPDLGQFIGEASQEEGEELVVVRVPECVQGGGGGGSRQRQAKEGR